MFCMAWNCRLPWVAPTGGEMPLSGAELGAAYLSQGHREPGHLREGDWGLRAGRSPGFLFALEAEAQRASGDSRRDQMRP